MSDFVLEAQLREKTGRNESRRLRRAGRVPAILYGADKPELPISLDARAIVKCLADEHFYTSLIELNIQGSRGKNTALLKDVQWDPVHDTPIHLDFQRVSSSDIVHVEVPVHAVHYEKCPGIVAGGVLEIIRHSLSVTCRADHIPEAIEVDCSSLKIGDAVHIEDITLPEGVEVPHDVNFTVITIAAPTKEIESAAEAAEEGGEAGE